MSSPAPFDAIVIAAATSRVKVCGLTLVERARRVAVKAGALRVLVAEDLAPAAIATWAAAEPARALVVVDASDHVIHMPLLATARAAGTAVVVDEAGA
ncbi:MAG: hypothetical protein K8W52_30775, partial [Deltaproteobacteria bacterium]|nr:hypothetical protein [Deltaproteobacteria bacterium]